MRRGIGERLDDLQLLDDRARPPVCDDQRERILVLGAGVDEVMSSPSISVRKCGRAFSFPSHLRQSYG
jgi:hypothetical protein